MKGESDNFNIGEYENRISERMKLLKEKQKGIQDEKDKFNEKEKENIENMKEKMKEKMKITGGGGYFMPEKYKEQSDAVSDTFSLNESQIETETENIDIVKFQKIIVKIVKKLFCEILDKDTVIDSEPFKKIVIPAFKEKQKEFENLEKILKKDLNEKEDLIKKIKKNGKSVDDKDILDYVNYVDATMKWTIINKNEINEYIKSEDEKEREKVKREKEKKIETERLSKMPTDFKFEGTGKNKVLEINDPKNKINIKVGDCIEYKKNKLSPLTTKKTVRTFDGNNIKYRKGSDIKKVHLADIWETIKVVDCPKKGGNAITRKFSSRVSRKTRRHKQTSR
jgi:hypothetical protein